jgi:hypothetical protein
MPYTNCSVCGAKALVGATRCPRCQAPFVSYDIGGERVATVNCPNCGVQRPVAIGVCPNCLMSTAPSGRRLMRGLFLAGVAIAALMAVGYAISRRTEQSQPSAAPVADTADISQQSDSGPPTDSAMTVRGDSLAPAPPESAPPKPARPLSVAVPDTGRWEYATAITWVRMRSAPTPESEVLRMIDSAQRVRLGPPMSGWRPVRVGVDRGWVDGRFFTTVTAPRP